MIRLFYNARVPVAFALLLLLTGCKAGMFKTEPEITPQQLQTAEHSANVCRQQRAAEGAGYRQKIQVLEKRVLQLESSEKKARAQLRRVSTQEEQRQQVEQLRNEVFASLDKSGRVFDVIAKSPLRQEMAIRNAQERLKKYSEIYARSQDGPVDGWEPETVKDRYFEARFNYLSLLYAMLLMEQESFDWKELSQVLESFE